MPRIFIIGGTGHIGGAILHSLLERHPEVTVKALVRDEDKASRLVSKYPTVQITIGDLDSIEDIESGCREAEIVVNAAPDVTHEAGIQAIIRGSTEPFSFVNILALAYTLCGLKLLTTILVKNRMAKGHYIQTSGAAIVWDEPGGPTDGHLWDDIADIKELISRDVKCTHRATDKIVQDASSEVNVAIISPSGVCGLSPSIEHPTPITMPAYLLTARALKSGFQVAQGQARCSWIHVLDLAEMYLKLIDFALSGTSAAEGLELWGPEAYYFGGSEEIAFADFMAAMVPVLYENGVVESTEIRSFDVEHIARASIGGENYDPDSAPPPADSWAMHIALSYGTNMRVQASRMRTLGWKPERESVVNTFKDVIPTHLAL